MKRYIDLHMHTNCSDGIKTPEELLEIVRSKNISVFSVTDHDNLDGYRAMRKLVTENDPELISGVELSTTHDGADMHILAYLFDESHPALNDAINHFQENRKLRGKRMVEKLNELGVDIKYEDVLNIAGTASVGRPHVARALLKKEFTSFYEEAFIKYIGDDKPAYVPKANFSPEDGIKLIHDAGGLAFLAHPGIGEKEQYLDLLVSVGLDGLEAYHSSHKQSQTDRYIALADRHRLLVSGGSDFHGFENRHGTVGSQKVPYRLYEKLIEAKKN